MDIVFIAQHTDSCTLFECMDDVMPGILSRRFPTLDLAKNAAEQRFRSHAGLRWDAPNPEELAYANPLAHWMAKGEASCEVVLVLRGIAWPGPELRALPG